MCSLFKFHWHCPLPHDKVQILGMPFKSMYCTFPSYCYEYSVFKTLFSQAFDILSISCMSLFIVVSLEMLFQLFFSNPTHFFPQAQLKCQILSKAVKPSSAGEIKCYLILLLFGFTQLSTPGLKEVLLPFELLAFLRDSLLFSPGITKPLKGPASQGSECLIKLLVPGKLDFEELGWISEER